VALEVGFNAGHSSALLLAAFPRASLRSFDLCAHAYAAANAAWLQAHFAAAATDGKAPGSSNTHRSARGARGRRRFSLTCGDSRDTLPAAAAADAAAAAAAAHADADADAAAAVASSPQGSATVDAVAEDAGEWPLADLVRVDGGHAFEVAAADLFNAQALARPHALVVLDDCRDAQVNGVATRG
jgi:hypothetical protein